MIDARTRCSEAHRYAPINFAIRLLGGYMKDELEQRNLRKSEKTNVVYDDTNRLAEVLDVGVSTASYVHNALGQRTKKTVGSETTIYIYDLTGKLIAEHDATGALVRDYVWLNNVPVAQIDQGELFTYLHSDHLGTPRLATDDSQTVVWRWDSDAFGTTFADEDPDGNGTAITVNLRYPGQYFDVETGFHYNYFRTYDPSTGRYLESDPIGLGGGLNTYDTSVGTRYPSLILLVWTSLEFAVTWGLETVLRPDTRGSATRTVAAILQITAFGLTITHMFQTMGRPAM